MPGIGRRSIASLWLLAGLVLLQFFVASSAPASTFRVTAGPGSSIDVTGKIDQTASTALSATGVMTGLQGAHGTATFAVAAGPGIARASLDASYSTDPGWPFNTSVAAISTTDLLVSGPPGSVAMNASLNVHVDGTITATSCGVNSGCDITLFLDAPGVHSEISAMLGPDPGRNTFPGLAIDPIPGGFHVHGDSAVPISFMSNSPFQVTLALQLGGRGGPVGTYQADYFTPASQYQLSFGTTGVVLNNIPAGFTVSGDGVVDNRWQPGSVVVSDCNDPQLASLRTIAGSLVIRNLSLCQQVLLPNLTSIGGDLIVTGNRNATVVDLGALGSVGGSIEIDDNGDGVINLSTLTTVGGSVDISDLSASGVINLSTLTSVGGSVDITTDAGQVGATTGGGGTDVEMLNGAAAMEVRIPAGAFTAPVPFTIRRLTAEPPAPGTAADGTPAIIDPLYSFQFTFAVPMLNLDASLSFVIDMTLLDSVDRAEILNDIASGVATIIGKGDAPGATYTAFPLCTGTQTPAANACAAVALLDANGQPTTGQPATVRFDGVVGHFSSYGIGTVARRDVTPPVITATINGTQGSDGWYRSNVTVAWTTTDPESAIASTNGCATGTVSTDTAGVSFTCTATSVGGTASQSVTIKRDLTAPVVVVTGVTNGATYSLGAVPAAGCTTTDALSGVQVNATLSVTGGNSNGTGTFTASCTGAMDKAGNAGAASVTYQVTSVANGFTFAYVVDSLAIDARHKTLLLLSHFTLGQDSDGIDPASEPVTLRIGSASATIPAGSFRKVLGGVYAFAGKINGVSAEVLITPLGNRRFGFQAAASGIDLGGLTSPATVTMAIGNDSGAASTAIR